MTSYTHPDFVSSIYENRVGKDKNSFYYLAIKNYKIRPKVD